MEINIYYLILGFIQGLTEPLPISSSGHVFLFSYFFGISSNNLAFAAIVNLASSIAIISFFWKDIIKIVLGFFTYIPAIFDNDQRMIRISKPYWRYSWLVILASIPVIIFGIYYTLNFSFLESDPSLFIRILGYAFLITALLNFSISINIKKDNQKLEQDINWLDAVIIGFYQVIALIPGVSRSGSTLAGSFLRKLNVETAFRFSFFLYIPISIVSGIWGIKDIIFNNSGINFLEIILSFVISFITTLISLKIFFSLLKKRRVAFFGYYCFFLGLYILLIT